MRIDSISAQTVATGSAERLRDGCREFESAFLSILLKGMRSTVAKGMLFGNDPANGIYTEMLDSNLAEKMAGAGGIGLTDMLYDQLKEYLNPADKDSNGGVLNAIG